MSGRGTPGEPFDIVTALANPSGILGASVYGKKLVFFDKTYSGDFNTASNMDGNSETLMKLKSQSTGVKIDGSIYIKSNYVLLEGFKIADLDFTDRETEETGSVPIDIPIRDGIRIEGYNCVIRNCIIYNTRQGLLSENVSGVNLIEDCIVFYNGWRAPDRGHGHGIYSGTVTIKNCVIFQNFGYGLHGYLGGDSIVFENCIVFDNGEINNSPQTNIIVGGTEVATNFIVKNCQTYFRSITAGSDQFIGLGNGGVIENNIFVSKLIRIIVGETNTRIINNKFYGGLLDFTEAAYPNNTYSTTRPETGSDIVIHPSDNYLDRAYVAIYNWASANTIEIDLSTVTGLTVGDTVDIINVQDYFVDIQELILDANKKIVVNMEAANRTVATPQGWTAPLTTFPTFGCFVVEKK